MINMREYMREWRKRKGKQCLCGNPAGLMKWGEPVCQRCHDLEVYREKKENRPRASVPETYTLHPAGQVTN